MPRLAASRVTGVELSASKGGRPSLRLYQIL